jgi:hypothetical protein
MTVKKVTVMKNDRLRKYERIGYGFGPLVKRWKGEILSRFNWSGMFAR